MRQTIEAQPGELRRILSDPGPAERAADRLAGRGILLIGVGTSWHAAHHGAWFLRAAGIDASALHAADAAPYEERIDTDDGVIVLSHTAHTGYSMQMLERARGAGAAVVHVSGIGNGGDVETVAPEQSYAYTASHTGSLAGSHGAAQAGFRRARIVEAEDTDGFFDALAVLAAGGRRAGARVAILTISGGPGVLASDQAERSGLQLPSPAAATVEALQRLTPSFAALGNPVDLTPQCPPENFVEAFGAVFDDPGYDGAIVINCGLDIPEFGEGVVTAAARTGKPVTAYVLQTPRIEAALRDAGIPLLDSPERAVSAYAGGVR